MADKAVSYVKGASKATGGAFAFEVMSPALEAKITWYLESQQNSNKVAMIGELDFKASPLVGAKLIVDMII